LLFGAGLIGRFSLGESTDGSGPEEVREENEEVMKARELKADG